MLCNPRYGRIGLVACPYFVFLETLGPVIEFLGYFAFVIALIFHRASLFYVVGFLMLAVVFGTVLSIASVALKELAFQRYSRLSDLLRLFALGMAENFGYRQMITYCVFMGSSRIFVAAGRGEK
jgi:hypothetical protein